MKVIATASTIASLGFVLAGSAHMASALEARLQLAYDETPCLAGLLTKLDVGESCTGDRVRMALRTLFDKQPAGSCPWDINYELLLITRTLSNNKAIALLQKHCEGAEAAIWTSAPSTAWTDIDAKFTPEFMDTYTEGGTFLNGTWRCCETQRNAPLRCRLLSFSHENNNNMIDMQIKPATFATAMARILVRIVFSPRIRNRTKLG
jgi:hypothetical protein